MSGRVCVKESVFPFNKLPGCDIALGPEMKSTGEVMGISENFAKSFAKSQISASNVLPSKGAVFMSLTDRDKEKGVSLAKTLVETGFSLIATGGTCKALKEAGLECEFVYKISEGRPNIEDKLKNGEIALVINTSDTKSSSSDTFKIRQAVVRFKLPYFTNIKSALAATMSVCAVQDGSALEVKSLQEYLQNK